MKNFFNKGVQVNTMEEATTITETPAAQQVVGGVEGMIADALAQKNGSAIKAFTPVFLKEAFNVTQDVLVFAERGAEKQVFTNPDMDTLGKLNAVGYTIKVELSEYDKANALTFIVKASDISEMTFPIYPSMVIDLGKDELLLVWKLTEAIDKAATPLLWKIKGIVADVIAETITGKAVPSLIPFAGFFYRQHAVRVLRYGVSYALNTIIDAFNADGAIRQKLAPTPVSVGTALNKCVSNLLSSGIIISAATFASPLAVTRLLALQLRDAGYDDDSREGIAQIVTTLLTDAEPAWIDAELEGLVTQVLIDPDVVITPKKKSRKPATKKVQTP